MKITTQTNFKASGYGTGHEDELDIGIDEPLNPEDYDTGTVDPENERGRGWNPNLDLDSVD